MKSGQIAINGLSMYYEIHGEGFPLVLLHGALSATGSSFGKYIPELAQSHQVIALEMQAHRRHRPPAPGPDHGRRHGRRPQGAGRGAG